MESESEIEGSFLAMRNIYLYIGVEKQRGWFFFLGLDFLAHLNMAGAMAARADLQ